MILRPSEVSLGRAGGRRLVSLHYIDVRSICWKLPPVRDRSSTAISSVPVQALRYIFVGRKLEEPVCAITLVAWF